MYTMCLTTPSIFQLYANNSQHNNFITVRLRGGDWGLHRCGYNNYWCWCSSSVKGGHCAVYTELAGMVGFPVVSLCVRLIATGLSVIDWLLLLRSNTTHYTSYSITDDFRFEIDFSSCLPDRLKWIYDLGIETWSLELKELAGLGEMWGCFRKITSLWDFHSKVGLKSCTPCCLMDRTETENKQTNKQTNKTKQHNWRQGLM